MKYVKKVKEVVKIEVSQYCLEFLAYISTMALEDKKALIADIIFNDNVTEKGLEDVLFLLRDYIPKRRRDNFTCISGGRE